MAVLKLNTISSCCIRSSVFKFQPFLKATAEQADFSQINYYKRTLFYGMQIYRGDITTI
jgi:hypothetical protein